MLKMSSYIFIRAALADCSFVCDPQRASVNCMEMSGFIELLTSALLADS